MIVTQQTTPSSSGTEAAAQAQPLPPSSVSRKPTAAERSRRTTRARLLASGLALFARRGLHGVTTHDVAAHAGLAAGTFYLHFSNKHALFGELIDEATAQLRERLSLARQRVDDGGEAAVRAQATELLSFAEDHRSLFRILFTADADAASIGADVLDELATALSATRSEKGMVPPGCHATVLSQAVVGMYARVLVWWVDTPERVSRESVIETLVRIQLTGTRPL